MTPAAANQNQPRHPYLRQEQFSDPVFIKVRRRVAMLRLPYAEDELRELLIRSIALYDEMLDEPAKDEQYDYSARNAGSSQSGMASPLRKPFKRPFHKQRRALTGAQNRLPKKASK